MDSIWCETKLPAFPKLTRDIRTDVLIIGGGMAGILTAYFLQQRQVDYVLVEKDRICGKTTGNTTAKITAQHGLIYHRILESGGVEKAKKYLDVNLEACRKYRELCETIDCDYERQDNYVYAVSREGELAKEMKALEKIGFPAEFCQNPSIPVRTKGAVKFPDQAQFHPLKFIAGIAGGLNIFEGTFVREMVGNTAVTDRGRIRAERVVVATHFPFLNKHGAYFLKLYQHRSYVMALKKAQKLNGMYVDADHTGLSFRNQGELMLLGGAGHRTGKRGGAWEELRGFVRREYPEAEEIGRWAAQDCMSLDGIPYIGRYGGRTQGLFVETGFNKWGMTSSMAAAGVIADILTGSRNEFEDLFDPRRSILKPQLLINGAEAVLHLLTPFGKRCPHLGCALKWNPWEHSWDCPCHGSRFAENGAVLDNPANGNLTGKK